MDAQDFLAAGHAADWDDDRQPVLGSLPVTNGTNGHDYIVGGSASEVIDGGKGRDYLIGNDGDDILLGGEKKDILVGTWGEDQLYGGAGDDLIFGVRDSTFALGGSGDDQIHGTQADDALDGGSGDDTIYGEAGEDLLIGSSGNDKIYAGAGADIVFGDTPDEADDFGDDFDDLIEAGSGDDFVYGGQGNDEIQGEDGNDIIFGGTDDGCLTLTNGVNVFSFMTNPDAGYSESVIWSTGTGGRTGPITMNEPSLPSVSTNNSWGGELTTTFDGQSYTGFCSQLYQGFKIGSAITYTVGNLADVLSSDPEIAAAQASLLIQLFEAVGKTAEDIVVLLNADEQHTVGVFGDIAALDTNAKAAAFQMLVWEILHDYEGTEASFGIATGELIYSSPNAAVTAALNDFIATFDFGEASVATEFAIDEVCVGDNLWGNTGDDTFLFRAGDGVDMIWDFQPGSDSIVVTDYADIADVQVVTDVDNPGRSNGPSFDNGSHEKLMIIIDAGTGQSGGDAIIFQDFPGRDSNEVVLRFVDDAGATVKQYTAAELWAETAYNPARADTIGDLEDLAPAGVDPTSYTNVQTEPEWGQYLGTEADDFLAGTNQADRMLGFGGDDMIAGGKGDDNIQGFGGEDIIVGGRGHDIILGGDDDDTIDGDEGNDHLYGEGGDDVINGGVGKDTIGGGDGNDVIDGGAAADILVGHSGDDTLIGGDANDRLYGHSGMDTIIGGAGNDAMAGGSEADTFVFGPASGRDTITDFQVGLDRLDFSAYGLDAVTVQNALDNPYSDTSLTGINIRQTEDWGGHAIIEVGGDKLTLNWTDIGGEDYADVFIL